MSHGRRLHPYSPGLSPPCLNGPGAPSLGASASACSGERGRNDETNSARGGRASGRGLTVIWTGQVHVEKSVTDDGSEFYGSGIGYSATTGILPTDRGLAWLVHGTNGAAMSRRCRG